jgi:hypothetical protein
VPVVQSLDIAAVAEWTRRRSIVVHGNALTYGDGCDYRCIEIRRPPEATRRLALAYSLLMTGTADDDETRFEGCLLWLTDYAIWSPTFERVGLRLLDALVPSSEQTAGRILVFDARELVSAQSVLTLCLLFEWDAYVVPHSGEFIGFISHDNPVQVAARTPRLFEAFFERFDNEHWQARERKCTESLVRD